MKNMCARLLACPLCSQPGFLTVDALRTGLISVATRPLTCPVCNDLLLGIDKLTIHLFSHTINLNANNTVESSMHTNIVSINNNPPTVYNQQNTAVQDWNISKVQTTDANTYSESNLNIQTSLQSSKSLQSAKDNKVSLLNSGICVQDQSIPLKNAVQVTCLSESICENEKVSTINSIHENNKVMQKSEEDSLQTLQEATKLNYTTQYYTSNDVKHANLMQHLAQGEHENSQTFKSWVQDQHCKQQTSTKENTSKLESSIDNEKPCNSKQNYNEQMIASNKFPSTVAICTNGSLEKFNTEKNSQDNPTTIRNESQAPSHTQDQALSQLKFFKTSSTKEKTERCDICGFHFLDYNILFLHKQLVHMIDEKDLNAIPENCLKNYSCHLCSKVFKMRGSLMVHMRVAHMGYNLGNLLMLH